MYPCLKPERACLRVEKVALNACLWGNQNKYALSFYDFLSLEMFEGNIAQEGDIINVAGTIPRQKTDSIEQGRS